MDNIYVILGIIGLLFLYIYRYAYGFVAYEDMKAKKEKERRQVKLANQKVRDIKLAKLQKRSEEMRQELIELENKKLIRGDQTKVDHMKQDNYTFESPRI